MKITKRVLPLVLMFVFSFGALWQILVNAPLVYGDVPYSVPGVSSANISSSWGAESLGTNVRLSPGAFRDLFLLAVAHTPTIYFIFSYLLPILLLPACYYIFLRKLKLPIVWAMIGGGASLANPVVFGDFLNGQTFWIYLVLPWIFYHTIQIFYFKKYEPRRYIVLALLLAASYGFLPPEIVPLIFVISIIAVISIVLGDYEKSTKTLMKIVVSGISIVTIFGILIAPYILIVPSGQAAYSPASLLADYYHNYAATTLSNTIRLAGNEGNGQSTLGYNIFTFWSSFGYLLFGIIIAGIIAVRKSTSRRFMNVAIILLVPFLVLAGFMDLMARNFQFGTAVFSSQWIVATIRNPTKIYILMLPSYVALLAIGGSFIQKYISPTRVKYFILISVAILGAYNWPILRGDMGLFYNRESKILSYKPDVLVASIAKYDSQFRDGRSLLVPSNHTDELNYQNISSNLSTLRLGGQLPPTEAILEAINSAFNSKDPAFIKLVRMAGISRLYLKNDSTQYTDQPFSLFGVAIDIGSAKAFLKTSGFQEENLGKFSAYLLGNNPLVFSPTHIANLNGPQSIRSNLALFQPDSAVVTKLGNEYLKYVDSYSSVEKIPSNLPILGGSKAVLDAPDIVSFEYSFVNSRTGRKFIISELNPISRQPMKQQAISVASDDDLLIIDDQELQVSNLPQTSRTRSGMHDITVGKLALVQNGVVDGSFETGAPTVGDASKGRKGQASIQSYSSGDSYEGNKSAVLQSSGHLAYFSKDVQLPDPIGKYLLTVAYKTIDGQGPSIDMLGDQDTLLASSNSLPQSKDWMKYKMSFTADASVQHTTLNFYTDSIGSSKSTNSFDAIKLYEVQSDNTQQLNFDGYADDYDIDSSSALIPDSENSDNNLVSNGSFEDKLLWGGVGDADVGAPGEPKLKVEQVLGGLDGGHAMRLSASNHTGYVYKEITNFDPNKTYSISMLYKTVNGDAPSLAIVSDDGTTILADALPGSNQWQQYQKTFIPPPGTKAARVFLYAPGKSGKTVVEFDDVNVTARSPISNYLVKNTGSELTPTNILINYQILKPTMISTKISNNAGLVVLNNSYHPGWKAFLVPSGYKEQNIFSRLLMRPPGIPLPQDSHILVDGYANGWFVAAHNNRLGKSYGIVFEYWPQRYFDVAIIGSSVALMIVIIYLAAGWRGKGFAWISSFHSNKSASRKGSNAK
jgi:hypothetical protein